MHKPFYRHKRFWLLLLLVIGIIYLLRLRPVQIILDTAAYNPKPVAAEPVLPNLSADQWNAKREAYLKTLERSLYGSFPKELQLRILAQKKLELPADIRNADIAYFDIEIRNLANDQSSEIGFVIVSPAGQSRGLILTQNFCPNHDVLNSPLPVTNNDGFSCAGGGVFSKLMFFLFGRYIVSPPFQSLIDEGYSVGILHPPEFIPDNIQSAQDKLSQVFSNYDSQTRPGTLISWAAISGKLAEQFSQEYDAIITWGHSRYGKTALLAAAYSEDIDGAIAHQSGTGGASLFRVKTGETLKDIVNAYPHWFGQNAQKFKDDPSTLPLDQHYLLAAIAPKPVLLGNARRDVWSDPEGAFHAAKAASNVYESFGRKGMTANKLSEFIPGDEISFWIRPGTHGITEDDWPAFLEFLNQHF